MDYKIHHFGNGIRLAYKQSQSTRVSHAGVFIDAGSRDEFEYETGLAHLLEHMLFKGTNKRNVHQVLNRLEVYGGELNAFTTKDKTCVYASIVNEQLDRSLELLGDVAFNSNFPEKELEKEKKVIFEEIDMYLDSPEERIYDEFLELFYPDHPLGTNILGSKEGLKKFKRTHLFDFRERTFLANRIIVVVVSPIRFERVLKMTNKYFEHLPLKSGTWKRKAPKAPEHFDIIQYNGFSQAHVMMGCEAFEIGHDARPALMLLSNILGGPGLNSKLNLVLREKLGYTYSVDSSYQSLTDSGCFSIYWSTDQKNVKKSKKAILNVLNSLIQSPLTLAQLHKYKTQFKGQMIMAEESDISLMFVIGKSLLDLEYCDSLNDILEKIDAISPSEIQNLAAELLAPDKWSYLTYLPEKDT